LSGGERGPGLRQVPARAREHEPVLRDAVLRALQVREDGTYVDATYGRGGHSESLLAALGRDGRLLLIDRDPQAVADARRRFGADPRVAVAHGRFSHLDELLQAARLPAAVHGIVFDLGLSSPQLDEPARGFSFSADGPLDMRMDPSTGAPLETWVNAAPESELSEVIARYGEERFARRIARALVAARAERRLTRCAELARICAAAVPRREPGKHPATRTFQAFRIFLNQELDELQTALAKATDCLVPGGRLAVISFHSLEDRIVKRFIRGPLLERRAQRLAAAPPAQRLRAVGRVQRPDATEVQRNPRARSARLRVAERVA